jgi:hypothetical protein
LSISNSEEKIKLEKMGSLTILVNILWHQLNVKTN